MIQMILKYSIIFIKQDYEYECPGFLIDAGKTKKRRHNQIPQHSNLIEIFNFMIKCLREDINPYLKNMD